MASRVFMGKPYSSDLRRRVLNAIDGGMSKMAAHQTFCVSRSTIDDWIELRARTGSVAANTAYRRGKAPSVTDEMFGAFCASIMAALWPRWPLHGTSKPVSDAA